MGGEIAAMLQEKCFLSLKAPVSRVTGYDTPFPLVQEALYLPTEWKIYDKVKKLMEYWVIQYNIWYMLTLSLH